MLKLLLTAIAFLAWLPSPSHAATQKISFDTYIDVPVYRIHIIRINGKPV